MRLRSTVGIGCIILMAALFGGGQSFAGTTLNFPRVSFDPGTLTGIAFVNPSDENATIRVVAYGEDGSELSGDGFQNPVDIPIPARKQIAQLLNEIFQGSFPADQVAWMQATSQTDGITGFFLHLDPSLTFFDGADLPATDRKIVFNQVRSDSASSTELSVFNPNSTAVQVAMTLYRPEAAPLPLAQPVGLPAKAVARFDAATLFGLTEVPEGSSLAAVAGAPIGGFEFVRFAGKDLVGLNAKAGTEALATLYFPQMAVLDVWKTELGVVSYAEEPVILTISAYRGDGTLFVAPELSGSSNPVTRVLPPGGTLLEDVADLFSFAGSLTLTGWLKVESTSPAVNGFVSYGIPQFGPIAAVAAQAAPQKQVLFSHIATDLGYFTGLALLNPGTLPSKYRVIAFTKEGERIGGYEGLLRPGQRVSRQIWEFVQAADKRSSGFFVVVADLPLYMTSLFGSSTVLANIAPQLSSALDSLISGPTSRITPPLAVIKPGASIQFQPAQFGTTPDWKVEEIPGGDSLVGTVSSSGLYRAPAKPPDLLPVIVSAEGLSPTGENQVSGAAADVLEPAQLLQNQGVLLSVTYLRSLKQLYSAELSGQGAFGAASNRGPLADDDVSRVFQLGPTPVPVATFDGERISKMIPFTASNGDEYLLFTGFNSGKVIRLAPNGTVREVITGLNEPSALVIDPAGGNLLVAEKDQVRSFPRHVIEGDLLSQGQGSASLQGRSTRKDGAWSAQIFAGLLASEGLAVDACTGRLYVSDAGSVIEYDRLTGGSRTLIDGLASPGQLLSLYRKGLACPFAFHLLVTNTGGEAPILLIPSEELVVPWVGNPDAVDLTFLPEGNPLADAESEAVFLGGAAATGSDQVEKVEVPGLYSDRPANPGTAIPLDFADALGDTFGTGADQPDAWSVVTFVEEATTTLDSAPLVFLQNDSTALQSGIRLAFLDPVTPAGGGGPNPLYGYLEFDTDQDPLTGRTSLVDQLTNYSSGIGVDFALNLGDYSASDQTIALIQIDAEGAPVPAGRVPVTFIDDPETGGTFVSIDFRVTEIDPDGRSNIVVLVGSSTEATDVMPNGGFMTSTPPPPEESPAGGSLRSHAARLQ